MNKMKLLLFCGLLIAAGVNADDLGTGANQAYRGDWGAAVSNTANLALPKSTTNALAVTALQVTGGATKGGVWLCTNTAIGQGKWSGPCAFKYKVSTATNFNNNVEATVVFQTKIYDFGNNFDGTNFTAPVNGEYLFNVSLYMYPVFLGQVAHMGFYTNNVVDESLYFYTEVSTVLGKQFSYKAYLTNGVPVRVTLVMPGTNTISVVDIDRPTIFSGSLIREIP